MPQRPPGGKVNAANLNLRGLDALANVLGTEVVAVSPVGDGPNVSVLLSQIGGGVPDPLLLSDGTVADPTYSFLSDPATGVFLVGASILAITAGGAEVARFVSAGGLEQLIVPLQNNASFPSFAFGDGNSGFYESIDNNLNLSIAGINKWIFTVSQFRQADGGATVRILTSPATATFPVYTFNDDADTGIGKRAADIGVLIAGGVNVMEFGEAGAAPLQGFFGTAAVAQPTGVAVTAAGIHAALVTLGLITA